MPAEGVGGEELLKPRPEPETIPLTPRPVYLQGKFKLLRKS